MKKESKSDAKKKVYDLSKVFRKGLMRFYGTHSIEWGINSIFADPSRLRFVRRGLEVFFDLGEEGFIVYFEHGCGF